MTRLLGIMMTEATDMSIPLSCSAVTPIVKPYLGQLAQVLFDAWGAYAKVRERNGKVMTQATASSRAMFVSDLMRQPAHRIFEGTPAVKVDDRHGRPWVTFDGGAAQVRFRKLTTALAICPSDSVRATRLNFHLGDPSAPKLDGLDQEATVLTAGYVLDAADMHIERVVLVCHIGDRVYYHLPLPGGNAQLTASEQLPLAPLTGPIIRSARKSAADKLQKEGDDA
ncbi:hypothetical protein V3G39_15540 [Dermatophilaceae bacterium Sec6.4]